MLILLPYYQISAMTGHIPDNKGKYGQAGYPAIEKLIDNEDFTEINNAFETAYGELIDISRRSRGIRTQRSAKKAMRALELTMELLRELLAIKYRLQEEVAKRGRRNH